MIKIYKQVEKLEYLSNYSNYGFYINGIYYETVEHYYQSEIKIINNVPSKRSAIIRKRVNNIEIKDIKSQKEYIIYKGILEKFRQNKEILYKLIETRNQSIENNLEKKIYGSLLQKVRLKLKKEILNNILTESKNIEVYIIGHSTPDADSIFSSYVLSRILKKLGIKAHFCILENHYDYCFNDIKLINDFLLEKPEIITDVNDKKFILVDHNDNNLLKHENIIGAIDHHIIIGKIKNILEIEYASTGLLIYDLFKEMHKFDQKEKKLIALTVLADTDYLCSSRFTLEDKKIYDELNLDLNEKELQKKYFLINDFNKTIEHNLKTNYKYYNYNGVEIKRAMISSYRKEYEQYFDKYKQFINMQNDLWLLIWCDYETKRTKVLFKKQEVEFDYLLSSTSLILKYLIEKNLF